MKIKWGILGTARIAHRVAKAIQSTRNGELCAVASRTKEKALEFSKLNNVMKAYNNYDDLLNDKEIDAVYIPLPNHLHKEWVIKAASNSKHVLCEKPFALTINDAENMFKVGENYKVNIMEGFMYRFNPATLHIKKLINENIIGSIKYIDFNFSHYIKGYLGDEDNYRYHKEYGGGALWDLGIYGINFFNYLFDNLPVKIIHCYSESNKGNNTDITFSGLLKYENNVICNLNCSFDYYGNYIIISGSDGQMMINNLTNTYEKKILAKNSLNEVILEEVIPPFDHFKEEITHFNKCIITGKNPIITRTDTILNISLVEKLMKTLEELKPHDRTENSSK
ncbi:MAG: Gfo/Idh/MocA family protein [Candidatus Thorarchaeota archaeon]